MDPETSEPTLLHNFESKRIVPPTPMNYHSMTHVQSFTEKKLQAQRPSLSQSRLDPTVYLDDSYVSTHFEIQKNGIKKVVS